MRFEYLFLAVGWMCLMIGFNLIVKRG